MTEPRKLRVFLCHASQDKPVVRELYQRLLAEGWIDPWLDEEKLLPGQSWDMEIEMAVENSDAVIVCLSNNSMTKEGYVQRELRFVLDVALEKPDGMIYIIPLRLDNCVVPRKLKNFHYLDYFQVESKNLVYSKLVESLQFKSRELNIEFDDSSLRSVLHDLPSPDNQSRISQIAQVLPWLTEEDWGRIRNFLIAQAISRLSAQEVNLGGKIIIDPLRVSVSNISERFRKQMIDFENGRIDVDGELIDTVSRNFLSAVKKEYKAVSSNDFEFWKDEHSEEYYYTNLRLIKDGVVVKRIFVIPKAKLLDKQVHSVILRQIKDKILVGIITSEEAARLITSVWDRDFAIYDDFAVSFFRNYSYARRCRVITDFDEIQTYNDLYKSILKYSERVPEKNVGDINFFENENEFLSWVDKKNEDR